MPRNPSGVFSLPAGSTVTTGDTILASSHNDPLNDIAADLNAARPVVAGGTGADSVAGARTNLGVQPTDAPAFTGAATVDGVEVATIDTFTSLGHRNKIMNGQFNVNQRKSAPYTTTGYTFDRWALSGSGSENSITRELFSLGQTEVPSNPNFYVRLAKSGTSSFTFFSQKIEGVKTLSGKTATCTFWAKASAATEINVRFAQAFGSGGSPSGSVTFETKTESITTSWQKFTRTIAVPSISGKTIGTNDDDTLQMQFIRETTATNPTATIDIANVSLVEGNATSETDPGAWRNETVESLMCRRYYHSHTGTVLFGMSGRTVASDRCGAWVEFPVPMRVEPTLTAGTASNLSSIGATGIGKTGGFFFSSATSSTSGGSIAGYTADAEL